eukprot:768554-Hanusia_phi.AAC.1
MALATRPILAMSLAHHDSAVDARKRQYPCSGCASATLFVVQHWIEWGSDCPVASRTMIRRKQEREGSWTIIPPFVPQSQDLLRLARGAPTSESGRSDSRLTTNFFKLLLVPSESHVICRGQSDGHARPGAPWHCGTESVTVVTVVNRRTAAGAQ